MRCSESGGAAGLARPGSRSIQVQIGRTSCRAIGAWVRETIPSGSVVGAPPAAAQRVDHLLRNVPDLREFRFKHNSVFSF